VPEVAKAVGAAEKCGEVCGVDEHNVARALTGRRHPDKRVELGVAGFRERMRPVRVDPLTAEDLHLLTFGRCEFVVGQVRVKVEGGDVVEQSRQVKVPEPGQRCDLLRALDDCWPQPPRVVHGHVERLHQRARVLTEALLARDEPVAVVFVLDLSLAVVVGEADVMMGRQQ